MDEDDEGSGENDHYILVNTSYLIHHDKHDINNKGDSLQP